MTEQNESLARTRRAWTVTRLVEVHERGGQAKPRGVPMAVASALDEAIPYLRSFSSYHRRWLRATAWML